jgi:hypothetical protein
MTRVHVLHLFTCFCEAIMTNLTISLDDAIVRRARIRAIEEGTSVSAKVREFLAQYARVDAPPNAALPDLPIFKGHSGLQQGIDPSSNKSMRQAADDLGATGEGSV